VFVPRPRRLFVNPVVLGGGTPYFSPRPKRLDLELIETQTFSQVVYLTVPAR
jgi:dihydrofolate reductase